MVIFVHYVDGSVKRSVLVGRQSSAAIYQEATEVALPQTTPMAADYWSVHFDCCGLDVSGNVRRAAAAYFVRTDGTGMLYVRESGSSVTTMGHAPVLVPAAD